MSKINCFRVINLNYNHNSMRIEDETFSFEGNSTLLSLQNGGGKSVLVQMMIAPFVRKRYRDTADRAFASFFTTNRPTFLLTEWVLDGGAGHVLVGMMVRQKQDIGDDSKDEIDIISFIHEYKEQNNFDIHSIPVIEADGKGKKLKGFTACKILFEDMKREKGLHFQYYDLNQANQQKKYFDRLKEFQINNTEWEAIIKKVNLKESGLSELFKEAKDEAGLVEKWFLSAVESKLNKEENRMKEFANIIHKFILQYKENQSKIERKETILNFQSDADIIKEAASELNQASIEKEQYEEKIAYLRMCLQTLLEDNTKENSVLKERIAILKETLQDIRYEEASYQLYCLLDELENLCKELEGNNTQKEQVKLRIDDLTLRLNTMECAGLYTEYKECSGEVLLLENKLEILRAEEKDLLPERNQLGYTLRCHYEEETKKHRQSLKEQEELYLLKQAELKDITVREDIEQKKIQELRQKLGQLNEKLKTFDREESNYNERYKSNLERNILKVYEEGILELKKIELSDGLSIIQKNLVQLKSKKVQTDENMISCSRDMEDGNVTLGDLKQQLNQQKELILDYESQLKERIIILRFIGLLEEDVFQVQKVNEVFERKQKEFEVSKRRLERKKEELEDEFKKLETGKILELPGEFSDLLDGMDVSYVYGMEWLKKNGNTFEVNQALIEQNPMLPYSIIMSEKELKHLSAGQVDFYTSFPIPIIRREDLTIHHNKPISCIYEMDKISFFILFNHHLLDEKSLRELLNQKQSELLKVEKLLGQKTEEIKEYNEKYNAIKYQTVTESNYKDSITKQNVLHQQIDTLDKTLQDLRQKKELLQHQQRELTDEINNSNRQEMIMQNQIQDFEKLYQHYKDYIEYQGQLEDTNKDLEVLGLKIISYKKDILELNQFIQDASTNRASEEIKLKDLQRKVNEYQSYQIGEIIRKDIEDIEARFEALTKKIGEDQLMLEESLSRAQERFDKKQKQLLDKQALYDLSEQDYKNTRPDDFAERELRKERSQQEEEFRVLDKGYNDLKTKIAVLDDNVKKEKSLLVERFEQSEPISRSLITDLEFKKRILIISGEIVKVESLQKICENKIQNYDVNLSNLAEFDHFTTDKIFSFEEELSDAEKSSLKELDGKELINFRGRLIRDYRKSNEIRDKRKEELRKCIDKIGFKKMYEEEFFKRPIDTIKHLIDEPQSVLEQLTIILSSYDTLLKKLEIDIAMVEREQKKIIEMLLDYICEIHKNIGKIDRNSTITVRERTIKMLKIKLPDWEEQESSYQLRLKDFIEELTIRGLKRLDQNENIEEMVGAFVTTKNLYDTVVGIGNVGIKLYKIEAQREYPITWAEVAKNSGGEGFLSAFVVLSSLLSYMRREDTDLFYEREEGKVLVMDNPFAQTNAAHLLKPLMDIARKNNTQLICLSGLGGESIYNRFDNIYILSLMDSGIQKDVQYLKGDHIKGEKRILTIQASQIKVEEMEQMKLLF